MEKGLNFFATMAIVFSIGYKIGNSSNDELKNTIDKFIDFLQNYGDKAKVLIKNFIESSEGMSSDEIKANVEKIMSTTMKKIDKLK